MMRLSRGNGVVAGLLSILVFTATAGRCQGRLLNSVDSDDVFEMEAAGRRLRQQRGPGVRVGTPEEFLKAFQDGENDIVVTSNLDLRGFEPQSPGGPMIEVERMGSNVTIRVCLSRVVARANGNAGRTI